MKQPNPMSFYREKKTAELGSHGPCRSHASVSELQLDELRLLLACLWGQHSAFVLITAVKAQDVRLSCREEELV